jgi:hypothetical protein
VRSGSWIVNSGQIWKIYVFQCAIGVGLGLLALFVASVNEIEILPGIGEGCSRWR